MAAPTAPPAPSREARRNARVIFDRLLRRYPTMGTALDYRDPWQLIVATVLSAQTTDEMVNRVTPVLFERWPTPHDLAEADPEAVERVVYPTGFYRQKTRSIIGVADAVVAQFDGEVPADLDAMTTLPGVGR
jgi:endonuclease-3